MTRSARWTIACVGGFVVLESVATLLYPGGTFWDRTTRGARFWSNFLCDLGSPVAVGGAPNALGALFGRAAMMVLAAGLAPFWWAVARLFTGLRVLGVAVRALGLASLAGTVAVIGLPSSRFGAVHGVAVIVAGAPGLGAALLAVIGLARAEPRPPVAAALGAATLVLAAVDFALYARTLISGGPGSTWLPVAQKLALVLLLAWMVAVAWKADRAPVTSAEP